MTAMPFHFPDLKTQEKVCPSCGHRTPRVSVEQAQELVRNKTYDNLEDAMTKGTGLAASEHWFANHDGEERPEEGWPHK